MGDYTNMSAYYDLIMTSGYYDYQKIVENIVKDKNFDSVLEIGCGWGGFAELAAREGAQVTGLTLSSEQLAFAQQRLANAGLAAR